MSGIERGTTVMRARTRAATLALTGAVVLAGCAEEKKPRAPTEQEIHARDFETASGVRGRHLYTCGDGAPLFVDFKDEGLSIELRQAEQERPRVLTAPAQGLQFVGDDGSATMKGNELRVTNAQGNTRVCRKQ
ncbi:hypothetical protein [Sphingomonas lenta]